MSEVRELREPDFNDYTKADLVKFVGVLDKRIKRVVPGYEKCLDFDTEDMLIFFDLDWVSLVFRPELTNPSEVMRIIQSIVDRHMKHLLTDMEREEND